MKDATRRTTIPDRWVDGECQGFSEEKLLLYRSNLLGSDLRVTNYGGGNTSAKVAMKDPLTGKDAEVLWVKGSGGDIGSMKLDGFSTLYMDKLNALKGLYKGLAHEDEMVGYLPHCTFNLNARAASIDTPLHAYIPFPHVDHVHPDSVIAIAASRNGEAITQKIFEGELGWLPWQRPGYDLGLKLEALCKAKPHLKGIMLGGHGFFTWGKTSKECYQNTLRVIQKAQDHIDGQDKGDAFGGPKSAPLSKEARERLRFAPDARPARQAEQGEPQGRPFQRFRRGAGLRLLARRQGPGGHGHFVPGPFPAHQDLPPVRGNRSRAAAQAAMPEVSPGPCSPDWTACWKATARNTRPTTTAASVRIPRPCAIPIPSSSWFRAWACSPTPTTRPRPASPGEFYVNAINVIRGAGAIDQYVGLPEQEAFDIEYWALEEAKLRRMPKPKSLASRIALITGGAGGIGKAIGPAPAGRRRRGVPHRYRRGKRSTRPQAELARQVRQGCRAHRGLQRDRRGLGDRIPDGLRARVRRPGHPGQQRRHRLRRGLRGNHAWSCGTRTSASWPRAISWSPAKPTRCCCPRAWTRP